MAQATKELSEKLNDPSQWVINRAVPVFEAHTRHFPEKKLADGRVIPARTVKVTEADLDEIVKDVAQLEASGCFGVITPGHRDQGKGETEQPPVYGYHRNPRVAVCGPDNKKRIVVDEYWKPEHHAEMANLPYRSADYYPDAKEFFGVAALVRRPALNLPVCAYTERGFRYEYAMEAAGPANAASPDTPEEEKLFEKARAYMCRKYGLDENWPASKEKHDDDNGSKKDAEKGDDGKGPVTPMANDKLPVQYQKIVDEAISAVKVEYEKKLGEQSAALAGIQLERDQERCLAMVNTLEVQGYALTAEEKSREVKKLCAIPAAERDERVKELRAIYAERKAPEGRVEVYGGHVEATGAESSPHAEPWYHKPAMEYMYANPGMQYDAAKARVLSEAKK